MHTAFCWSETADADANHDLTYAYSDDNGRTEDSTLGAPIAVLPGDDSDIERSRTKSQCFDSWRDTDGSWTRVSIGIAARALHAVSVVDRADSARFFSDPLIDSSRLLSEDKLIVIHPQKSSPNIYALDYFLR